MSEAGVCRTSRRHSSPGAARLRIRLPMSRNKHSISAERDPSVGNFRQRDTTCQPSLLVALLFHYLSVAWFAVKSSESSAAGNERDADRKRRSSCADGDIRPPHERSGHMRSSLITHVGHAGVSMMRAGLCGGHEDTG